MTSFRCLPIDTGTAARFRETRQDDGGNMVRQIVADEPKPCRHCLNLTTPGEAILLGSYHLRAPQGVYWTPSPIFVHADPCPQYAARNELAPIVRQNRLISIRAYDAADFCLYDLGEVCDGQAADAPLERALADTRTRFVNIHTARPGCLLCRVERDEATSP